MSGGRVGRAITVPALLATALCCAMTGNTLSSWSAAGITNSTNSTYAGAIAFTHAYQSTSCALIARDPGPTSCPGSIAPSAAVPASGAATGTDAITDNGTVPAASLTSQFSAPSCAPVRFLNKKNPANPLMARNGLTFHASGGPMDSAGYVTPDGAGPGGYATSVVQQAQPPTGALALGPRYGVGIWFKATAGGPLFGFASSPANSTTGSNDRIMYLDAAGKVNFVWNSTGDKLTSSSGGYADGAWHFGYATFSAITLLLATIPQVTLYVDGAQVAQTPSVSLNSYTSYNGYWHLAWAPTSTTGLASAYGSAQLSNLVVLNTSAAPTGTTIGKPTTQAGFDSLISGQATEQWILDDTGTTTFTGSLPPTMANPCGQVNIGFALTNPAASIATQSLAAFANGTPRTVAAPGPGATQGSTISTQRAVGYSTDVSGLHLYAPLTHRVFVTGATNWTQTFTWAGPEAAFIG